MKLEDILAEIEKRLGPLDEKARKAVKRKRKKLNGKAKTHPLSWRRR
jgi:hypothetical protein